MALTRQQVERKLAQHDNDIESIYDIMTEHGQKLDRLQTTVDGHGKVLDQHSKVLDQHGEKLDGLQSSVDEVLRRLPEPPTA